MHRNPTNEWSIHLVRFADLALALPLESSIPQFCAQRLSSFLDTTQDQINSTLPPTRSCTPSLMAPLKRRASCHDINSASALKRNRTDRAAISQDESNLQDAGISRGKTDSGADPQLFDDRIHAINAENDWTRPQMLYEGSDFEEWQKKTEMMLIAFGHFNLSLYSSKAPPDVAWYSSSKEAADLVKHFVRPTLLSRVRDAAAGNTQTLIPALHRLCSKSFRLLDLPTELRLCIYEFALHEPDGVLLETPDRRKPYSGMKHYQPALSKVSRKVRGEAMEVFFQTSEFRMIIEEGKDFSMAWETMLYRTGRSGAVASRMELQNERVRTWSLANRLWLRHLRNLAVTYKWCSNGRSRVTKAFTLSLRYSSKRPGPIAIRERGPVTIRGPGLNNHDYKINRLCKRWNLKGEALALWFCCGSVRDEKPQMDLHFYYTLRPEEAPKLRIT